jgi:hypothetical protein
VFPSLALALRALPLERTLYEVVPAALVDGVGPERTGGAGDAGAEACPRRVGCWQKRSKSCHLLHASRNHRCRGVLTVLLQCAMPPSARLCASVEIQRASHRLLAVAVLQSESQTCTCPARVCACLLPPLL